MSRSLKVKCPNCGAVNSKRYKLPWKRGYIKEFKCNSCKKLIPKELIERARGDKINLRVLAELKK